MDFKAFMIVVSLVLAIVGGLTAYGKISSERNKARKEVMDGLTQIDHFYAEVSNQLDKAESTLINIKEKYSNYIDEIKNIESDIAELNNRRRKLINIQKVNDQEINRKLTSSNLKIGSYRLIRKKLELDLQNSLLSTSEKHKLRLKINEKYEKVLSLSKRITNLKKIREKNSSLIKEMESYDKLFEENISQAEQARLKMEARKNQAQKDLIIIEEGQKKLHELEKDISIEIFKLNKNENHREAIKYRYENKDGP